MILTAQIETIPKGNSGTDPTQTDEISAEAETYETAREALRGRVPAGWRIMNLRRT